MTIKKITLDIDARYPCRQMPALAAAAEALFDVMAIKGRAAAYLRIVGDNEIQGINLETRGINAATDVLSFPSIDHKNPVKRGGNIMRFRSAVEAGTHRVFLGDIILSAQRAEAQALEYGHKPEREYAYLCVHALLHLLGYDHKTPSQTKPMREYEEKTMQKLELPR